MPLPANCCLPRYTGTQYCTLQATPLPAANGSRRCLALCNACETASGLKLSPAKPELGWYNNPDKIMGLYCLFPRTPGLFSSLNVQKNMLQDSVRNCALQRAIRAAVKPEDIVIDLGTGTGVLAIWAADAGAKRVYAIEETDVALVAEAVVKSNGYADRISVIRTNSGQLRLPERADVLIAEVVGHFLFEEGIVEYIADVRERLVKPGARIIPAGAQVFVAPVELHSGFSELSYWENWKSPDLSVIRKIAANSAYIETVLQEAVLAKPAVLFEIDFHQDGPG